MGASWERHSSSVVLPNLLVSRPFDLMSSAYHDDRIPLSNGHKIRCPEERAGLPAKCPKCGVKFRIPDLSADDEAADDAAVAVAAGQANGLPEVSGRDNRATNRVSLPQRSSAPWARGLRDARAMPGVWLPVSHPVLQRARNLTKSG